jgi:hypothetical protein
LAWCKVWKYAWFGPLLALYRSGVITRDQFEDAAFAPTRDR